jgi:hypothetical protein
MPIQSGGDLAGIEVGEGYHLHLREPELFFDPRTDSPQFGREHRATHYRIGFYDNPGPAIVDFELGSRIGERSCAKPGATIDASGNAVQTRFYRLEGLLSACNWEIDEVDVDREAG